MTFLSKEDPNRWYHLAWWLCVITLPWLDIANNIALIFLTVLWLLHRKDWRGIISARWAWPFFLYYTLLVVGLIYTSDVDNALFTLDKKITFVMLPLVAITGRPLHEGTVRFLKRWFVYSCSVEIIICLFVSAVRFFSNESAPFNFDPTTTSNYNELHPLASSAWMHFSYIRLVNWTGLQPAYFSMYLIFCLVILLEEKRSSRVESAIHFLISVIMIGFIGLLSIRMAIIAFVLSAFYLGIKKIQEKQFNFAIVVFFMTIMLGIWLWLNPVARFHVMEEPMTTAYKADTSVTKWNSLSYRLLEWGGSWSIIKSKFLFGVGTGGGTNALNNFYDHFNKSTVGLGNNSHNQYLQTWMENGIIGLVAFLCCLFSISFFNANISQSYVAFILIFSLMCLTESIGERQKGIVFFTLFQTLFLGFENKRE